MRLFSRNAGTAQGPGTQSPTPPVLVNGGYKPDTLVVPAGEPVRLVFQRHDASPCSEEVVFPDQGVRAMLPQHEEVVVELPPSEVGEYEFHCGMGMLRGRLVAR